MPLKFMEHILILTHDPEGTRDWFCNNLGFVSGYHPEFGFPVYWLYIGEQDVVHIGKAKFSDHQDTLKIATGLDQSAVAFERHHHGNDHGLVGALLSHTWCLPTTITDAIRHHHDITVFRDSNVSDHVLSLLAINHLAEYLTNHNNDYHYSEWSIHADQLMEYLHITENDLTDLHSQVNNLLTNLSD